MVVCSLNNVIMPHFIVAMLTQITNIWANFAKFNSVRVHPYAYPQHMKVLKHFSYIKYECGKHQWWSMVSTLSSCHHFIVAMLTLICHNLGNLHRCNSVRVHPFAYPQHMKVLRHILCIQYGCGKQSVVFYSLNNVIMSSFQSHTDPNLPKSGPTWPG